MKKRITLLIAFFVVGCLSLLYAFSFPVLADSAI